MKRLADAVCSRVGQQRYNLWFGSATQLRVDGEQLIVAATSQFTLDYLRRQFRDAISEAGREVLRRAVSVQFALENEADVNSTPAVDSAVSEREAAAADALTAGDELVSVSLVAAQGASRRSAKPAAHKTPGAVATAARSGSAASTHGARRGRKFAKLDEFIVGAGNRVAHGTARLVTNDPGCISPLLVHGPTGVGKTHLLEGIWSAFRRQHPQQTAVYLSAEQFTTYFLEALRGTGLPTFRRKYRGVQLLIIDDLQFLAGKRATLVELLHTIDTLQAEGKQLVFAADRPASELAMLGNELVSRLEGGMSCRMEPADVETRLGILQQLATRRNLELPAEVAEMIAAGLSSHTRELLGAINRLHATSQALKQPITVALAHEALGELLQQSGRTVRLPDIERAVCDVFGLDAKSLHSNSRTRGVTHPRMLAMWLARKHTRAALSEIGQYFGCRAHSTVVSASKKVEHWVETQSAVRMHDREYSVDEALRRLEDQLRCG